MRYLFNNILLVMTLAALTGCEAEGRYETLVSAGAVLTLDNGVAVHETGYDRVVYFAVQLQGVTPQELYRARSSERLRGLVTGPGGTAASSLFVTSLPTNQRDPSQVERLLRLPIDGSPATTYVIGAPFDTLVFDDAGRFAILYHDSENGDQGADLSNPNEIAVLDLTLPPSATNPRVHSIDMDGARIQGAAFISTLTLNGAPKQIAVFLSEGKIRLVDVADPTLAGVKVNLKTPADPRQIHPVQILARDGDGLRDPVVFVRATGSQDIYAVSLIPNGVGASGFGAAMNLIETGGQPLDMAIIDDSGQLLISAVSSAPGTSVLRTVNVDTTDVLFSVDLEDRPTSAMLRGLPGQQEVVFFGPNTRAIHFLMVPGLVAEEDSNLSEVPIPGAIAEVVALDQDRLLIVPQDHSGLILFDLRNRQTIRLSSHTPSIWTDAKLQGEKLFFVSANNDRILTLDLVTGHPDALLLDDAVSSLHLLAGSNLGVVLSTSPTGRMTVFPLDNPTREAAKVVDGLWLGSMLDEEEVSQ
ncbi:MAG: hypothetical protein QNJ97_09760 [Myxococcota bacterium]|nr:hypothetical protein [Myxococcota bacterium]